LEKKDLIYNYYPVKISDIYNEVYIFSKCGHKEIYKISSLSKKLHLNLTKHSNPSANTTSTNNFLDKDIETSTGDDDQDFYD
jgi:hypothetical protein